MALPYDPELRRLSADPKEARGLSKLAQACGGGGQATKEDILPANKASGRDAIRFVWRILAGTSKQLVRARAVSRMESLGIPAELQGARDLETECEWQIIAEAMRDPEDPGKPLAADVDQARDLLNDDERAYLITSYLDFEETCDPTPFQLGEGELDAMVHAAKKKPSEAVDALINFGSRSLALCITTLVDQLASSQTGKSGGSPASDR